MCGTVKVGPFEGDNELVDDRSNLSEDGANISSRVVGWGNIGYAKTISIQ